MKRGLGRGKGLDNIFDLATKPTSTSSLLEISIEKIRPNPEQPRKNFSDTSINELAQSMLQDGVIQPLIVYRSTADDVDSYIIVAGERRWRAASLAGLHTVPCMVTTYPGKHAIQRIALVENIQREDLNTIEEAQALASIKEEFALTDEGLANQVGKTRSSVTNLMRLLKLDPTVQTLLINGGIQMGHARALLSLPKSEQILLAEKIIEKGLSVREVEKLVSTNSTTEPDRCLSDAPYHKLSLEIHELLTNQIYPNLKVKIAPSGKSSVIFNTDSIDELKDLLIRLGIQEDALKKLVNNPD